MMASRRVRRLFSTTIGGRTRRVRASYRPCRQSPSCQQSTPCSFHPTARAAFVPSSSSCSSPTRSTTAVCSFSSWSDKDNNGNSSSAQERTNSFRVALFPQTAPNSEDSDKDKKRLKYPRSFAAWKRVFVCAWANYKSTWEGFLGGSGDKSNDDDDDDKETRKNRNEKSEVENIIDDQKKTISDNVETNTAFVKEEAPKFFRFLQHETKIYTKEDLKEWAGEQLKLATLCLNEFMGGYRSGRDGEMDRMLNEYFQEGEHQQQGGGEQAIGNGVDVKRKRRKPKRLVRSA